MIEAEGWYLDPFDAHELRWFSAGNPTALVRDGATEGRDEPPAKTWDGPLREPEEVPAIDETVHAGDLEQRDEDQAGHYG